MATWSVTARAAALIVAVADRDAQDVTAAMAGLTPAQLRELATTLAGSVADDRPLGPVDWLANLPAFDRDLGRKVRHTVAEVFRVHPALLLSRSTSRQVIDARHVAMWIIRRLGWSYPRIGVDFDRDHTTALYGVRRVASDARLRAIAQRTLTDARLDHRPVQQVSA